MAARIPFAYGTHTHAVQTNFKAMLQVYRRYVARSCLIQHTYVAIKLSCDNSV